MYPKAGNGLLPVVFSPVLIFVLVFKVVQMVTRVRPKYYVHVLQSVTVSKPCLFFPNTNPPVQQCSQVQFFVKLPQ